MEFNRQKDDKCMLSFENRRNRIMGRIRIKGTLQKKGESEIKEEVSSN